MRIVEDACSKISKRISGFREDIGEKFWAFGKLATDPSSLAFSIVDGAGIEAGAKADNINVRKDNV